MLINTNIIGSRLKFENPNQAKAGAPTNASSIPFAPAGDRPGSTSPLSMDLRTPATGGATLRPKAGSVGSISAVLADTVDLSTPQSCLKEMFAAMKQGDVDTFIVTVDESGREFLREFIRLKSRRELKREIKMQSAAIRSIELEKLVEDRGDTRSYEFSVNGRKAPENMTFVRELDGWHGAMSVNY